jgi:hypothetical protein
MNKFLTIFIPVAAFATGVLWLLLNSFGFDPEASVVLHKVNTVAPFVLGPGVSAALTLFILRLAGRDKKTTIG